jgi:hypothetical protein
MVSRVSLPDQIWARAPPRQGYESYPWARFDLLPLAEPQPERDEERSHVLEEKADAHRWAADRDEVEHGDEEEACESESD